MGNNKATPMNKEELLGLLFVNSRLLTQIFCPIFGVAAREAYEILKSDNYKFRKILPKLVLAWFVCLIIGAFVQQNKYLSGIYPFVMMTIAFSYRQAADFISDDLFPFVLKYLNTKNIKKDD